MYDLHKPVGPNKPNLPDDVRLIQSLFGVLRGANDYLVEGIAPIPLTGFFSPELGAAILHFQKKAKQNRGKNVVDGFIDPLPSRSGLPGDWDRDFRNGVSSTLTMMCYRVFRFNREAYLKLGDTLNLKWAPDPFVPNT